MSTNMIEINAESLKKQLIKRGLKYNDVSQGIGHNRNYLTDVFKRKRLSKSSAKMLELLYNIKLDDYIADTYKKPEVKENENRQEIKQEVQEIDYERIERIIRRNTLTERELFKVINQAVYKAVKKAQSE